MDHENDVFIMCIPVHSDSFLSVFVLICVDPLTYYTRNTMRLLFASKKDVRLDVRPLNGA